MTPQLQQAIRLLQLSTLDLQQEIQEALESNPMLEVEESFDDASEQAGTDEYRSNNDSKDTVNQKDSDNNQELSPEETWNDSEIPQDLSVDSSWDDIYINSSYSGTGGGSSDEDFDFESRNSAVESLQDHLHWQLNLTPMSDGDRLIATAIIDAIDSDGHLTVSTESIHAGLIRELDIDEDEVTAVLHRIQQFDPVGVGYRDLRECLTLQLQQFDKDFPGLEVAAMMVQDYLPQLASHDYSLIMKKLKIKEPELKQALKIILALNPRPGSEITVSNTSYVVPDVFVYKDKGRWKVELNPETAPKLRVNPDYA
ncbi:MAG: RNA polymerase factor sigma-54, partial [Pseudohongiellaceae bacterium]